MSRDQRLNNLGIPTNLPPEEEERLLTLKERELEAKLKQAEAEYNRTLGKEDRK